MSEFDLINQFFKAASIKRDDVLLGIGDDCAILSPPQGKQLAVSTDTLISGVHFPESTAAEDIGYKSLAVNLSDLAAMGADPAWVSLAISLPKADENWLGNFMRGFNQLAEKYNVTLIGGDTTQGSLSVTVNITGFVDADKALKRSRAKVGDSIFVSGNIGDSAIGLKAIFNKLEVNRTISEHDKIYCINRLNRPVPRIEAGQLLRDFSVAAIDISDGLMADLNHICEASGVGALLNLQQIPLSQAVLNYYDNQPDWQDILSAGDDYELCFTCAENQLSELQEIMDTHNVNIFCIGKVTHNSGIKCLNNDQLISFNQSGYKHFK